MDTDGREKRESQLGRGEEKGAAAGRWDAFFRGPEKRARQLETRVQALFQVM